MPEGKKPSYRNSWLWGIECSLYNPDNQAVCPWKSNLFPCPKTAVKDLDNHHIESHGHSPENVYEHRTYAIIRVKRDFKKHPLGALKKGSESKGIPWDGKA